MAPRALLILGLAGLTSPAEAAKSLTEHGGLIADTVGFLGQAFGARANKSNGTLELLSTKMNLSANKIVHHARKMKFIKRSLVNDEGESLEDRQGLLTEDACEALCEAKAGCKSFTFKPGNGNSEAWCHLKPKCVDAKTPEKLFPIDVFSTFFKSYVNLTWTERALVADEGSNIAHHEGMSLEKCQKECHGDPKCNSISFGGGWCHLKDKCVTTDAAKSTTEFAGFVKTYYLPCTSESDTWHERSLVADEGAHLAEFTLSLADCEIKCDADPVCNSFSYQRDSSLCRLHDKVVTKADPSNAPHTAYHTYYRPC